MPNVVVISTSTTAQTEEKKAMAKIKGAAPGLSGTVIADLTTGGLTDVHRNKKLNDLEKEIMIKNLANHGWLIITGHGAEDTKFVRGAYESTNEGIKMDIDFTAKDYVNLVLQGNEEIVKKNAEIIKDNAKRKEKNQPFIPLLKPVQHLNVLLNVCEAGEGKDSFAKQLAYEFAQHGISSKVIASKALVGRISGFDSIGDIKGKQLRLRTPAEAILVFEGSPGKEGPKIAIKDNKSKDDFYIKNDDIGFEKEIKQRDAVRPLFQFVQGNFSLTSDSFNYSQFLKTENFYKTSREAEASLGNEPFILRASSEPNHVTLTYVDGKQFQHERFSITHLEELKVKMQEILNKKIEEILKEELPKIANTAVSEGKKEVSTTATVMATLPTPLPPPNAVEMKISAEEAGKKFKEQFTQIFSKAISDQFADATKEKIAEGMYTLIVEHYKDTPRLNEPIFTKLNLNQLLSIQKALDTLEKERLPLPNFRGEHWKPQNDEEMNARLKKYTDALENKMKDIYRNMAVRISFVQDHVKNLREGLTIQINEVSRSSSATKKSKKNNASNTLQELKDFEVKLKEFERKLTDIQGKITTYTPEAFEKALSAISDEVIPKQRLGNVPIK